MANWNFNPNDYTENDFSIIPMGDHRVRISNVVEKRFNSGNEGYEITLDVSGRGGHLWYYLVLDHNDPKKTNQRIGSFFDSFGIRDYNMANYRGWLGKVGAVRVKHEEYNGSLSAKVAFCISASKQDKLPAWKEPNGGVAAPQQSTNNLPDDLPFN